jgi:hypothetical protein
MRASVGASVQTASLQTRRKPRQGLQEPTRATERPNGSWSWYHDLCWRGLDLGHTAEGKHASCREMIKTVEHYIRYRETGKNSCRQSLKGSVSQASQRLRSSCPQYRKSDRLKALISVNDSSIRHRDSDGHSNQCL